MIKDQQFLKILSECKWMYSFENGYQKVFYLVHQNRFIVLHFSPGEFLNINANRFSPIDSWIMKLDSDLYERLAVIRNTVEEYFGLQEIGYVMLVSYAAVHYVVLGIYNKEQEINAMI